MAYVPNTLETQQEMLETIGVKSVSDLFRQIPGDLQLNRPLAIPPALTELELEAHARDLASRNAADRVCFMGGGAYDHYIPSVVDEICSRGEFYTAYTPYQAEASQGSLQAFYEFQTLICQLTGMDVSNASLYEGGTSVSEAAFMAMRVTDRYKKIVILGSVNPEYRQTLKTNIGGLPYEIVTVPTPEGSADPKKVADAIDEQTACVIFQQPNFYGCLESVKELTQLAHAKGALAIASVDPLSLGVLRRPGDDGVDITVAEGQSLGIPLQYGGPFLGLLACKNEFVRKMPGRLIAEAFDRDGKPCYVLGLQTREQHIRRDKATSNICTNQGLMALRATVYMSLLGPQGIKEAAELSCQKAHYLADQLRKVAGIEMAFDRPFFKEFVIRSSKKNDAAGILEKARMAGFDIGPELSSFQDCGSDRAKDGILIAVTEKRTKDELDRLVGTLAS